MSSPKTQPPTSDQPPPPSTPDQPPPPSTPNKELVWTSLVSGPGFMDSALTLGAGTLTAAMLSGASSLEDMLVFKKDDRAE